jgi:hypothetical protein
VRRGEATGRKYRMGSLVRQARKRLVLSKNGEKKLM